MAESEATIQGMFDGLAEWGASIARMVVRGHDDEPLRAVIVVDGIGETQDVLDALDEVEAAWEQVREADDARAAQSAALPEETDVAPETREETEA